MKRPESRKMNTIRNNIRFRAIRASFKPVAEYSSTTIINCCEIGVCEDFRVAYEEVPRFKIKTKLVARKRFPPKPRKVFFRDMWI